MDIELPLLRLGLAGFSPQQRARVADALDEVPGESCEWELADFDAADAWCFLGERTSKLPTGRLRVAPGAPGERPVELHLPEVARPIAFARPLPRGMEAPLVFDLDRPDTLLPVLSRFEEWLRPMRAFLCLGSHIASRDGSTGPGLYEVAERGRLLAMVDMHGDIGVRPDIQPADFERAVWTRAHGARELPREFFRASLSQVMWQYAGRSRRELLPARYRQGLIYWRRPPRLPQRLMPDDHLRVMRALIARPSTVSELEAGCGVAAARLGQVLAALYFVGSITANPDRASASQAPPRGPTVQGGLEDALARDRSGGPRPEDLTAPVGLPRR